MRGTPLTQPCMILKFANGLKVRANYNSSFREIIILNTASKFPEFGVKIGLAQENTRLIDRAPYLAGFYHRTCCSRTNRSTKQRLLISEQYKYFIQSKTCMIKPCTKKHI